MKNIKLNRFVDEHHQNTPFFKLLVVSFFGLGIISLIAAITFTVLLSIASLKVPTWLAYITLSTSTISVLGLVSLRILKGSPYYSLYGNSFKQQHNISKLRTNNTLDLFSLFNFGGIFYSAFLIWFHKENTAYAFILLAVFVFISVILSLVYILIIKNKTHKEIEIAYLKTISIAEKNGIIPIYTEFHPIEITRKIEDNIRYNDVLLDSQNKVSRQRLSQHEKIVETKELENKIAQKSNEIKQLDITKSEIENTKKQNVKNSIKQLKKAQLALENKIKDGMEDEIKQDIEEKEDIQDIEIKEVKKKKRIVKNKKD